VGQPEGDERLGGGERSEMRSGQCGAGGPDRPCRGTDYRRGARLLGHDGLEAIRLLTNHDLDTGSPFATVLLGQPTLATKMKLGVLAALDQRITVRHQMTGMNADETARYIRHHLALAGRSDPLFTDDAINLIHTNSRGKPRSVNNLALAALIAARAQDKTLVDEASARSAITETTTDHPAASP